VVTLFRQDNTAGNHRPGKRTTAGLVNAGYAAIAKPGKVAF
jgi:hypothetical protein